jgi:hypothetical protein
VHAFILTGTTITLLRIRVKRLLSICSQIFTFPARITPGHDKTASVAVVFTLPEHSAEGVAGGTSLQGQPSPPETGCLITLSIFVMSVTSIAVNQLQSPATGHTSPSGLPGG